MQRTATQIALNHGLPTQSTVDRLTSIGALAGRDGINRADQFNIVAASRDYAGVSTLAQSAARYGIVHPQDIADVRQTHQGGVLADEQQHDDVEEAISNATSEGPVNRARALEIARTHGMTHPADLREVLNHVAVRNADEGHGTGLENINYFQVTDPDVQQQVAENAASRQVSAMMDPERPGQFTPNLVSRIATNHGVQNQDSLESLHIQAARWNLNNGFPYPGVSLQPE